jgi:hypothetical protein
MPDLLTHILIAWTLAELFNIQKKSIVILGAILPDIIYKISILNLFFNFGLSPNYLTFGLLPFHSPIGLIIVSILLCYFFIYPKIKFFLIISLGWTSHILIDLFNKHYLMKQTYLFAPFSFKAVEFGLFWQDEYILPLVISSFLLILVLFIKKISSQKKINNKI